MIVKVVKGLESYYSSVFAISNQGFHTSVITFDNKNNKFEHLKMYEDGRRKVFILNCDEDEFVEKERIKLNLFTSLKSIKGYDWLLEKDDVIKKILKNQPIDEEYIQKAQNTNSEIVINEWENVNSKDDINNLLSASCNFHDSYLSEMVYTHNKDRKLKLTFSNCSNAVVTLLLEGDIKINFESFETYDYIIYNVSMILNNDQIYFVLNNDVKSVDDINSNDNYFKAKVLKWKIETC